MIRQANDNLKPLRDEILDSIRSGQTIMKPRWHFVLRAALLGVGVIMVFILLLYLISFFIFSLHQTGIIFLPGFGLAGWYAFIISLPWILLGVAILFFIILETLARQYAFAYRRPYIYTVALILPPLLFGGILVAQTSLHEELLDSARGNHLPVAGRWYREFENGYPRDAHVGTLMQMTPEQWIVRSRTHETFPVLVTRETRFPLGTRIVPGDTIVIFGTNDNGIVRARGVRKVDPGEPE